MRMRISSSLIYKVAVCWWIGAALSAGAAVSSVTVENDVFVPATSSIHAGDSVVWHWDGDDHNVTSTSNPQAWKASPTETSTTFTFTNTFNTTGTFPYECTVHASVGMLGTIKVAAALSPPAVTITSPASGVLLAAPANVTITANATDADGTVTSVEFLAGTSVLGTLTSAPYSAMADGLAAGNYTLSVIATDSNGLKATNSLSIQVFTPVSLGSSVAPSVNVFQFSYVADPGFSYLVQRSTDLSTWVSIATNTASSNPATYSDDNATNNPAFYRIRLLPNQ